jgi:hypothetical protein
MPSALCCAISESSVPGRNHMIRLTRRSNQCRYDIPAMSEEDSNTMPAWAADEAEDEAAAAAAAAAAATAGTGKTQQWDYNTK